MKSRLSKIVASKSSHIKRWLRQLKRKLGRCSVRNKTKVRWWVLQRILFLTSTSPVRLSKKEIMFIEWRSRRLFANESEIRRHWRIDHSKSKDDQLAGRPFCPVDGCYGNYAKRVIWKLVIQISLLKCKMMKRKEKSGGTLTWPDDSGVH